MDFPYFLFHLLSLNKPLSSSGTAIDAQDIRPCQEDGVDSPYCDFAESYYNWGVFENAMKWSNMEPEYNTFQTYNMELSFAWSEVKVKQILD